MDDRQKGSRQPKTTAKAKMNIGGMMTTVTTITRKQLSRKTTISGTATVKTMTEKPRYEQKLTIGRMTTVKPLTIKTRLNDACPNDIKQNNYS